MNNQVDNQDDYQDEYQVDNQEEKIFSCSVFLEQINLINQLPINERGNVIYMALLNAFIKNQKNQVDNQLENAYISISTSISLSILSKSVLDVLNKTINCKKYKNNWGGKRNNSGRPKKKEPVIDDEQALYGEYNNVFLTKEQYGKLVSMCASEKLLNELMNSFSINIEVGKERPYEADLPNAHFERLKAYYNFRKKYPDKFQEVQEKKDWKENPPDWYVKAMERKRAEGCIYE